MWKGCLFSAAGRFTFRPFSRSRPGSLLTSSGSIDLRTLCIAPGRHCWAVYVDVLVLESGGSLLDTMALAVYAALLDTRLPKLRLVTGANPNEVEVDVDEDPTASMPFPGADGIPVCVTFLQASVLEIGPLSHPTALPHSLYFYRLNCSLFAYTVLYLRHSVSHRFQVFFFFVGRRA